MLGRLGTVALVAAITLVGNVAPARAELLFQDDRPGANRLRVMPDSLNGSSTALFPTGSSTDQQASLSGDRTKLVFESTEGGWWDVWAANLDGGGRQQVGGQGSSTDGLPSIAPDGNRFAFQTDRGGSYNIYVGDIAGTAENPIAAPCPGANESDPDWHPSQDRIVYQSSCSGGNRLYVTNLSDNTVTELTTSGYHTEAKWSPDGTKIAWTNESSGDADIWVMNADGGNPQRVNADNFADDRAPSWSSDGSRIAFVSNRAGDYEIYSMPAAGGPEARHTDDAYNQGGLDWVGAATPVVPDLTVADVKAVEGSTLSFTLQLSAPAKGHEYVVLSTTPGSADGTDYASLNNQTITFAAGETAKAVNVSLEQDSAFELEETFDLTISDSFGLGVVDGDAIGTIDNDDAFPTGNQGLLAYECNQSGTQDLCLRDVQSGFTANLTNSLDAEYSPKLSPDGTRVAFMRGNEIWTSQLDGGGARMVLLNGHQPDWFPNGTELLVTYDGGSGQRLYKVTDQASATPVALTGASAPAAYYGDVSLDGTKIVYSCREASAHPVNREICTVNADGSGNLVQTSYAGTFGALDPSWSPDGSSYAYYVDDNQGNPFEAELHRANADGTGDTVVDATDGFEAGSPTWSPDSTRIAWGQTHVGSSAKTLQVIDAGGANKAELVGAAEIPSAPEWWAATLPIVSIADVKAPEGDALKFKVTLSRAAVGGEQITFDATPDTASASDLDAISGLTVSFAAGETVKHISVPVKEDATFEREETVSGSIYDAVGLTFGDIDAVGRIDNDDPFPDDDGIVAYRCNFGEICLRAGAGGTPIQVTSGEATYNAPVISPDGTRIAATTEFDEVATLELDGGGKRVLAAGTDPSWFPDSNRLAYSAPDDGNNITPLWVSVIDDAIGAAPTQVSGTFYGFSLYPDVSPDGSRIVFSGSAVDGSSPPKQLWAIDAGGGNLQQLTNLGLSGSARWPAFSPDGTRIAFVQYNGNGNSYELRTIAANGSDSQLVEAGTISFESPAWSPDGTRLAYTRQVLAPSSGPQEISVIGTNGSGRQTLVATASPAPAELDWGTAAAAPPSVAVADEAASEGGPITFTITLDKPAVGGEQLDYATVAQTATAGEDFTAVSGTHTFVAGATQFVVTVPTASDSVSEGVETLRLDLSNVTGLLEGDTSAVGTIQDVALPTLKVDDAADVVEGGTAQFAVTLTGPAPPEGVSVQLKSTATGTATPSQDFTPVDASLPYSEGETGTKLVSLSTTQDAVDEPAETVVVSLTAVGAVVTDGTGEVKVIDDDDPVAPPVPTVGDATAAEGEPAVFTVTLDRAAGTGGFTVPWTVEAGSASADDFTAAGGQLTVPAGATSATFSVPTTEDSADEPEETFLVKVGSDTGTGTIGDDDEPAPRVRPEPSVEPTPAQSPSPAPQPDQNESVVAQPVKGTILVKLPGSSVFVDLSTVKEIPNGTIIDARKGRVEIRTAAGEVAVFYDGIFKISQAGGLTTLTLQGPVGPCGAKKATTSAAKKKRRLWGSGKGRFRTAGKYASATVRGTTWMVEDSCKGTLTRVTEGTVTVRDNVKRKDVVVKKGKTYLARPRAAKR